MYGTSAACNSAWDTLCEAGEIKGEPLWRLGTAADFWNVGMSRPIRQLPDGRNAPVSVTRGARDTWKVSWYSKESLFNGPNSHLLGCHASKHNGRFLFTGHIRCWPSVRPREAKGNSTSSIDCRGTRDRHNFVDDLFEIFNCEIRL